MQTKLIAAPNRQGFTIEEESQNIERDQQHFLRIFIPTIFIFFAF